MRTIFVFPRASREETVRRLDGFAPTRTLPNLEAEWVLDDVVWIRLRDNADAGLFDDWDPGMVDALAKAQGGVVAPWALIARLLPGNGGGLCVDLGAQVAVTVEERPVHSGRAGNGRHSDL